MKDIYRFWSRKKLKLEIENLKDLYNQIFCKAKALNNDVQDLLRERCEVQKKLSNERTKNRKLRIENKKLLCEHQKLYNCIQEWYTVNSNCDMAKLIEKTKKVLDSFVEIVY